MNPPIRLLLVDDHSLFRESLSRLLQAEPDFLIAGTCATAAEAVKALATVAVDVVLLDFDLGHEQGSAFLDAAARMHFQGKILMVTAGMTGSGTLRALESGASGIFLKHSPPSQLLEAIHKVHAGEIWLDSKAVGSLVAGASGKTPVPLPTHSLTPRESSVLRGVFEGFSNKEIAARLQLSESSVKATLQQLFDKTGVRTRSQLVRIALERHSPHWLNQQQSS